MNNKLLRVGTTYIPVANVDISAKWYVNNLGAVLSYQDEEKVILNLADQSFFLVKAAENQNSNFTDSNGNERFSMTFEVDGLDALEELHNFFKGREMHVGNIENRGHVGRNFVFADLDGNKFDVWSELSPNFKEVQNLISK
ncbi:VOC family protein [Viridibacillus arvi]|uniref:Glyoxalase n=1 Tax=Viridibacillus arvi TaxID=263475 RepID=A0A0M0LKX3_9BACL|nr:VOC family protein [Viridibacillus arvi]KOO51646.1 glyoxalase [Viridibacillus arvi]